ncbi:rCG55450 [Rattus norvegicus]|uniref:RCG55450 n=1 Tax=Rattus norvegicus TaxID=10116 RepID=A6JRA4_RAT|nr:rCG55450 [Rattus norvegicus]
MVGRRRNPLWPWRTPAHGKVLPTARMGLPPQLNLSGYCRHDQKWSSR